MATAPPAGLSSIAALNGGKGPTPAEQAYFNQLNKELPGGVAPGSTSTANTVGADAYNYVNSNFPQLAWMLQVPELASVINEIVQQGITDPNQISALVENTDWFKSNSGDVRSWYQLELTDPAAATEKLQAVSQNIQSTVDTLGVRLTQDQINALAYADAMNNWSDEELKNHISSGIKEDAQGNFSFQPYYINPQTGQAVDVASGRQAYYGPGGQKATPDENEAKQAWGPNGYGTGTFNGQTVYYQKSGSPFPNNANQGGLAPGASATSEPGGTLQATQQSLETLAKQYMVTVPPQTLALWAAQIASNQQSLQGFQSEMQRQALSKFGNDPGMAQAINAGQSPLQYVTPYSSMIERELGIDSSGIDWTQPTYAKLLTTTDPKSGMVMSRPVWDAEQIVRTDPTFRWDLTPNGQNAQYDTAANIVATMGKASFGSAQGAPPLGG